MSEQSMGTMDESSNQLDDAVVLTKPELPQHDAFGWVYAPPAPWRRYGARMLDIMINGGAAFMLIGVIMAIIAPDFANWIFSAFDGPGGQILDLLLTAMIAGVVNAIILFLFGSTLGKVIFGIRVRTKNGARLSFSECFSREVHTWVQGLGCAIPLVNLATLVSAYNRLTRTGETLWDVGKYEVSYRPAGSLQTTLNILGIVLVIAGRVLFKWLSEQPA